MGDGRKTPELRNTVPITRPRGRPLREPDAARLLAENETVGIYLRLQPR
ncbi:hypothetical protein [Streptomyces sp. NPDC047028]